MAKSKYSPPEMFTNLDRLGYIQDEHNVPMIYYLQRHRARKAIYIGIESIPGRVSGQIDREILVASRRGQAYGRIEKESQTEKSSAMTRTVSKCSKQSQHDAK